jgi:hypothetical protein
LPLKRENNFVKRFTAILFVVLLVCAQFAPASVATAACGKPSDANCAASCGGHMACCAAKPDNSQPSPAVPVPSGAQNEISLLAPGIVAWILPSQPTSLVSPANVSPLVANGTPLFTRHCAFLI